jgi:hypothetical protein
VVDDLLRNRRDKRVDLDGDGSATGGQIGSLRADLSV